MTNLEKLRHEMPSFFELMDKLHSQIAEATADYHIEIDRLRMHNLDEEDFRIRQMDAYHRFRCKRDPLKTHLDAMIRHVSTSLLMMPPEPIIVSRDGKLSGN